MTIRLSPFDPTRFSLLVQERQLHLGVPCHYVPVTGSTNVDLMSAARGNAPAGALHVADLQTQGRGRHGNRWASPRPAENLLFSVLLRSKMPLQTASCFTLAVGLAVRDAVQPYLAQPVGIKWTNDVYVAGRKLAGILVESQLRDQELSALVVGIGLNVHMTELPEEIANIATSMRLLGARCLDRELLLTELLAALERRLLAYERSGLAEILDELREHDAIYGKRVRVGQLTGIAGGITDQGALVLDQGPDGGVIELTNGLVEVSEP
ncbi:MAG TPA: biotin--[acetyl-CoA-carboxylase] ligase [Polyangiaceae bacterium]|nr:biotin--[acetyl-CoA-carboxylase] ligase [Polyangiaceae bacterium]